MCLFLCLFFVLASGITILQVAANPYVAALGPEKTAASRLNLAQAANSLAPTVGPIVGAILDSGCSCGGCFRGSGSLPDDVRGLVIAAALVFRHIKLTMLSPC